MRTVPKPEAEPAVVIRPGRGSWRELTLPDPLPGSDILATLREERGDR